MYWLLLIFVLDVVAFLLYGIDKRKAVKNKWRIKESTLITMTLLGGIGGYFGMQHFHHKTLKTQFKIASIGGLIINLAAIVLVFVLYL